MTKPISKEPIYTRGPDDESLLCNGEPITLRDVVSRLNNYEAGASTENARAIEAVIGLAQRKGKASNLKSFDIVIRHKGFVRIAYFDSFNVNAPTVSVSEAVEILSND